MLGFQTISILMIGFIGTGTSQSCTKVQNIQLVGYDSKGSKIETDIGKCVMASQFDDVNGVYVSVLQRILLQTEKRRVCEGSNPGSKEHFNPCAPTSYTAEYHDELVGEDKFVEVVQECGCKRYHGRCKTTNKRIVYFEGTNQEKTVNVKTCQDMNTPKPDDGKECQAVSFSRVELQGPSRTHVITQAESCKMKHACKRRKHNAVIKVLKTDKTGRQFVETKILDVGKCGGKCAHSTKCVFGSSAGCIASIRTTELNCAPKNIVNYRYLNIRGKMEHIQVIKSCHCV